MNEKVEKVETIEEAQLVKKSQPAPKVIATPSKVVAVPPIVPGQPAPGQRAPGQPPIDPAQVVEQNAYVPTYKVKPEFKDAVLKAIGRHPFNQIASIIQAINVEIMDHNSLTQVINVLGQFPYIEISGILTNVNSFVEQILEE